MTDADRALENALAELVPSPALEPDWGDAVRRARRASRARRLPLLAVAAAFAAALFALAALDPFGRSGSGTVLERAIAAVGNGPVLHVVFREPYTVDAVINRATGTEEAHPAAESEIWYDADRGVHYMSRLSGLMLYDVMSKRGSVPEFDALKDVATDYQGALASGRATVVGPDELDGARVYWIRISERRDHARRTPSGPPETFTIAQEVAVSADTYRPVATRYTENGTPLSRSLKRIIEFETLAAGGGDFAAPAAPAGPGLGVLCCKSEPSTLEAAGDVLGRRPVWLGASFSGLPLAQVRRLDARTKPADGDHFNGTASSVELFYGSLDATGQPDPKKPHVRVDEGTPLIPLLASPAFPPAQWAILEGQTAATTQDGVQVKITGEREFLRPALDALTTTPRR